MLYASCHGCRWPWRRQCLWTTWPSWWTSSMCSSRRSGWGCNMAAVGGHDPLPPLLCRGLWSLDLCTVVLPEANALVFSKHDA